MGAEVSVSQTPYYPNPPIVSVDPVGTDQGFAGEIVSYSVTSGLWPLVYSSSDRPRRNFIRTSLPPQDISTGTFFHRATGTRKAPSVACTSRS